MVRQPTAEQAMALFGFAAVAVIVILVIPPYNWSEDGPTMLFLPVFLYLFWFASHVSRTAEAKELRQSRRRKGRRAGPRGGR